MKISDALLIGRYIQKSSFFHLLNSPIKILIIFFYTIIIFLLNETGLLFLFFIVLIFSFLSKINFFILIRGIKPIIVLLIITFILNLIFIQTGKEISIPIINIKISEEALRTSAVFSLQIILAMFFAEILTFTTTPIELIKGIEILLKPLKKLKLPIMQISLMFVIALKFIPITLQELENIISSQKIRGINLKNLKLNQKIFYFISLIIPLFVVTLKKTEHLAIALEMKCFNLLPVEKKEKKNTIKFIEIIFFIFNILIISFVLINFFSKKYM
ncbi:MAG TPA: energy-coupling factor transporter transmembrane component T [bacterium]|nr:energy-coupling factor transporter transmembrane component T [bacterium]HOL46948.1 energy-coupling factor transporter transmembrane component T [bacterium]HPQ18213.1 energy-coupling factor transporter transmembrane component T [bacterium]